MRIWSGHQTNLPNHRSQLQGYIQGKSGSLSPGFPMFATQYGKDERNARVDAAIRKDLGYMNYVLNKDQYKKYVMLLNVTMANRGLR